MIIQKIWITAESITILAFIIAWLIQVKTKRADSIDVFWTFSLVSHALIFSILSEGDALRRVLLLILVSIWGFRLGLHLLSRISKNHEDGRYEEIKANWSNIKFFLFYMAQALSVGLLSIGYLVVTNNPNPVGTFDIILVILFLAFLYGEAKSDSQLSEFKKNNPNQLFTSGLYKYSRHPNYFFESMLWWIFPLLAIGNPYWFIAIIPAAIIFFLIYFVTGIPPLEERAQKKYGKIFEDYCSKTNKFIPWIKI